LSSFAYAEDLLFAVAFAVRCDEDPTPGERTEEQPQLQRQKQILRFAKDDKE